MSPLGGLAMTRRWAAVCVQKRDLTPAADVQHFLFWTYARAREAADDLNLAFILEDDPRLAGLRWVVMDLRRARV